MPNYNKIKAWTDSRGNSALALLVTGVAADHPDYAISLDNLALTADFLDRRSDFHVKTPN